MPKYAIKCTETRVYELVVEAPTIAAARSFYEDPADRVLDSGFLSDRWHELDWVRPVSDLREPDIQVDAEGEEVTNA